MKSFQTRIRIVSILLLTFGSVILHAQDSYSKLFDEVTASINTAREQYADILCPLKFADAVEHYNNSKMFKANGRPTGEIIIELEKSKSSLAGISNDVADKVKTFAEVLAARDSAKAAGAERYSIKYWPTAEDKLKDAVEDFSDRDYKAVRTAVPTILLNYNTAKEYADYENYLLAQWEPLQNANNQLANLLSALNYKRGISKFNEALTSISGCRDMNSIKQIVNDAGLLLNKAAEGSKKFTSRYPELIQERQNAAVEGAEIYSAELWNDAEEALTEAATSFNKNETDNAVEYSLKAKQKYLEAKHLTLRIKILSKANQLVEKAKEEGAEEYAPKSFNEAKALIKSITNTINSDVYNYSALKDLAAEAEAKADLTIKIIGTIKSVDAGGKTWEELILDWNVFSLDENKLSDKEIIETPSPVKNIITEPEPIKEKPSVPEMTVKESAPKIKRIPWQVYKEFNPDEAEFIDNGNEFIIKLTGVEFSKRSSLINNKTGKLIDKLICAFDYFSYAKIVVAAQSNDMTSEASNQKLSQRRAEKIRSYIVRQGNTNPSRIFTARYKGTATNIIDKTKKEYEKNCLIEIILEQ